MEDRLGPNLLPKLFFHGRVEVVVVALRLLRLLFGQFRLEQLHLVMDNILNEKRVHLHGSPTD